MPERKASDSPDHVPPDSVDEERVASRAALGAEELAAGSDDPETQARAILEDGEERRRDASQDRDPDSPVD